MIRRALLAAVLLLLGLSINRALGQEAGDPAAGTAQPPPPSGEASDRAQEDDESWGMNSLRGGFEAVSGYFDSMLEFMGGRDGVCQYRCRYGFILESSTLGFYLAQANGLWPQGDSKGDVQPLKHACTNAETDMVGDVQSADQNPDLSGKAPLPRPGFKMPEPDGCSSYFFGLPVPEGIDVGIPAMTKCCNQLDICYDTCGSNKYRCDSKFRWCLHSICSDLKKSLGFVSKVEACETVADTLFNTVWTLGCKPYMNSQRAACLCPGEEKDEL